jgi:Cof subfamily protein (haloacid dehalogenase superfamily)
MQEESRKNGKDNSKNKENYIFNKDYKLMAIDIDGTLLDKNSQITQSTCDALQKIKEKGITITFATGRFYPDAIYFAKLLGFSCPMILLHGALIQSQDGKVIRKQGLPPESIPILIEIAKKEKVPFQIFHENFLVIEKKSKWNDVYLSFSEIKPVIVPDINQYLKNHKSPFSFIYLGTEQRMAKLKKVVEDRLNNTIAIASAHPNLLEIIAPDVSKGRALKELAAMKNIPLSQTIAIGDSYNDMEVLKAAGLGVAMGNAPQEVKDIADYITKDNDNDGIAYFVSQYLARHTA